MGEMVIDESSIATWSKLGPRATYGLAMFNLLENDPKAVAATADLGNSSGLDRLKKTFPDRFLDVGIAEQNLIGVAAGVAKEGFTVFASSFAPFITMRACEQLRMNLGYMEFDIKAVAIGSGLSMNFLGNSHFGLEDVSIVRSIPNIEIVSPADCTEVIKAVRATSKSGKPTYIRLTGVPGMKPVNKSDYEFVIGKNIEYFSGSDVTILATGSLVHSAIMVADQLSRIGVKAGAVNCHTLRPFDVEHLIELSRRTSKIVTIEEHFVNGGLGTEVIETLNNFQLHTPVYRIGIPHNYDISGSYEFLLDFHELTSEFMFRKILNFLSITN
jgi:transketolase